MNIIRTFRSKNCVTKVLCSSVTMSSKPMFFCLTQKPHPFRRPPLCRRGAGGEAVPQERENQINTLVLKDINFTINIIELSYYRTIDILNQSKMLPWYKTRKPPKRKPPPAPLPRERVALGGAWGGFFFGGLTLPVVHSLLYSPFLSVRGRGCGFSPLLLSSSTIRRSLQPTLDSIPFPA